MDIVAARNAAQETIAAMATNHEINAAAGNQALHDMARISSHFMQELHNERYTRRALITDMEEEIEDKDEEIDELKEELEDLRDQLRFTQGEVASTREQLHEAREERDRARQERDEAEEDRLRVQRLYQRKRRCNWCHLDPLDDFEMTTDPPARKWIYLLISPFLFSFPSKEKSGCEWNQVQKKNLKWSDHGEEY